MLVDNKPLLRRLMVLVGLVVILLICLTVFNLRSNEYAPTQAPASYKPIFTNSELLQNWLPPSSYQYTVGRIDNYLQTNNVLVSYMTILGNVSVSAVDLGAYNFTVLLEPQNQTHLMSVTVDNYSGTISTAVSIDGQQQSYTVPTQSSSGAQFSGLSSLVKAGVTSLQSEELQTAFQKFAPSASNVSINTSSIILPQLNPNNPSLTNTYSFTVSIGATTYKAKLNCIGLNEVDLFLTTPKTGEQVYDSGVISQN